jgi:acyl dehydratase
VTLHADPEVARAAGFERPILHGMCTYGIVAKAVVDTVFDSDVEALRRYRARFTGVVYPGDPISVAIWEDGGTITVDATDPSGRTILLGVLAGS